MGQVPAKYISPPGPFSTNSNPNVVQMAKQSDPAPLNNFLPLNPQDQSQQTPVPQQQPNYQNYTPQDWRRFFGGDKFDMMQ